MTVVWLDVSSGVAGDMMLAALLDLGVDLGRVQGAVDAVLPGVVRLATTEVSRAGLRARRLIVDIVEDGPARRTWTGLRERVVAAALPDGARDRALRAFERLAAAEAIVHGCPVGDVHFHEVGAADSVADVVGVCAALDALAADRVIANRMALGSGRVVGAHGDLPVPVPAVLELVKDRPVYAGGEGELTTPTGAALVAALSDPGELPDMVIRGTGVGAGTRDTPGRANVVRAVLGGEASGDASVTRELVIECNVDDLDPRIWPTVLDALLAAGARDAWLTPILMKKGRPAHTLAALCPAEAAGRVRAEILAATTTIGMRETWVDKRALARAMVTVHVAGAPVTVKVAHDGGCVLNVMPEFDEVARLAQQRRAPVVTVLAETQAAARAAGIVVGAAWPHHR